MISILTTTYNRAQILKDRIESTLNQTYENFELFIIDDNSIDDTESVVKKFKDSRIKYIKNSKNLGSVHGDRIHIYNFFYNLAKGRYFIYAPDDDYWPDKNFLKYSRELFNQYPSLQSVMGSQVTEFYENYDELKILSEEQINDLIKKKNKNYYSFKEFLPQTGFYEKKNFLRKFSLNPATYNISDSASLYKRENLIKINYLKHIFPSKWQAGYELKIPNLFLGDIYFIAKPCAVVRANKNNASFTSTQINHYKDSILSIRNAFSICPKDQTIDNKKIEKIFVKSLSNQYLANSIHIFDNGKLELCSEVNINSYVTLLDVFTNYGKYLIIPNIHDIKLYSKYLLHKFKYLYNKFLRKK